MALLTSWVLFRELSTMQDRINRMNCLSRDAACNGKANLYGAAQPNKADYGTNLGLNTASIDAAEVSTRYVCHLRRAGRPVRTTIDMNSNKDSLGLGSQQRRVVDLLLQVCDNAEIASELKIARRTVLE